MSMPQEKAAVVAEGEGVSSASVVRASVASDSSSDAEIPIDFDGFELSSEPTHPELFPNLEEPELDEGLEAGAPTDEHGSPDGAASDSCIERRNDLPTSPWNEIPEPLPFDSPTKPWNGPPPSGAFEVGDHAEPSDQAPADGISIDAPTRPWSELSPSSSFEVGQQPQPQEPPLLTPPLVAEPPVSLLPNQGVPQGRPPSGPSEPPLKGPPPLPSSKPPRAQGSLDVLSQRPVTVAVPPTAPDSAHMQASERLSTPLPKLRPTLSVRKLLLAGVGLATAGATAVLLMSSAPSRTDLGGRASRLPAKEQKAVSAVAEPPVAARHLSEASASPAPSATPIQAAVPDEDTVEVTINIKPDGSTFYYKGKMLGKTPFVLKHPRGEKRAYDVGKMGYAARQVLINGAKKSIGFSLTRDGARRAK